MRLSTHAYQVSSVSGGGSTEWRLLPGPSDGLVASAEAAARDASPMDPVVVTLLSVEVQVSELIVKLPLGVPASAAALPPLALPLAPAAVISPTARPHLADERPSNAGPPGPAGFTTAQNKWALQWEQEKPTLTPAPGAGAARVGFGGDATKTVVQSKDQTKALVGLMNSHPKLKEELMAISSGSLPKEAKQKAVDALVTKYKQLGTGGVVGAVEGAMLPPPLAAAPYSNPGEDAGGTGYAGSDPIAARGEGVLSGLVRKLSTIGK